jgi:hypothetical protein
VLAERSGSPTYLAFMLRLWRAGSCDGLPIWRASLENPHTGERLAFGNAKELITFLADLMADLADGIAPLEKVEPGSVDDGLRLSSGDGAETRSM